MEPTQTRLSLDLQAAYAAGKAAARFDRSSLERLRLAGTEADNPRLRSRLESISHQVPDDEWQH